jgi:hypothetical protein
MPSRRLSGPTEVTPRRRSGSSSGGLRIVFCPLDDGHGTEDGRKGFPSGGSRGRSHCTADARFRFLRSVPDAHSAPSVGIPPATFEPNAHESTVPERTGIAAGTSWGLRTAEPRPNPFLSRSRFRREHGTEGSLFLPKLCSVDVLVRPLDLSMPTGARSGMPRPYPICLKKLS